MNWRNRLNDRLNPILIKEVRQAVRGKFFRVCFVITLIIAMFAAIILLSNAQGRSSRLDSDAGSQFFFVILMIFSGAAFLVVPLQANRSMASEKDDKTYDALITSGLRPTQIILGKWLSAGLLLLLFLSAFAPFLAIAFTLFGINILACLTFLFFTLVISMSLNLAGLFAACIANNRAFQTILLAMLALAGLASLGIWGSLMSTFLFFNQLFGAGSDFPVNSLISIISIALLNYWLFGYTVSAITHREENGLMHMRFACLGISGFIAIAIFILWTNNPDHSELNVSLAMGYAAIAFLNIPLLTESDHLGVRCRHQLQSGRWKGPIAWMFLPGGTGAVPLYLFQIFVVSIPLIPAWNATTLYSNWIAAPAIAIALCLAIVLIPSALMTPKHVPQARRFLSRVLIPSLPIFLMILSTLMGIMLNSRGSSTFDSSLNPFNAIEVHLDGFDPDHAGGFFMWWFLAGAAVLWRLIAVTRRFREIRALRSQATTLATSSD